MKTVDYPFIRITLTVDGTTVIPSVKRLTGQWQPETDKGKTAKVNRKRPRRLDLEQVKHDVLTTPRLWSLLKSGRTTGVTVDEFDLVESSDLCWHDDGVLFGETFILRTDVGDIEALIDERFERLTKALSDFALAANAEYAETIARTRNELEYMEHEATHVAEGAKTLATFRRL